MQRTLRAGWHNHCCQESCHPPLPPTHPARKSDEKIRLHLDENLFCEKILWKVLFNPKKILILQKLYIFALGSLVRINGHVTLCFFQKGLVKKARLILISDNKSWCKNYFILVFTIHNALQFLLTINSIIFLMIWFSFNMNSYISCFALIICFVAWY